MGLIVVFVALLFLYALAQRRLTRTIVTAPMVFAAAGAAAAAAGLGSAGPESAGVVLHVAELGLVLLLFSDASRIDFGVLRKIGSVPARLLSLGLLLTIVLGGAAALWLLPGVTLWEAAIVGAILAPTDAGLGQVVVTDSRVPVVVRRALSVEAGLNDGLAVPFLLFFVALADAAKGGGLSHLAVLVLEQLGLGAALGAALGFVGGRLVREAEQRRLTTGSQPQFGLLAIPVLCLLIAEPIHASMFIAAFVAGVGARMGLGHAVVERSEFAESVGQLLNLAVFFLFGTVAVRLGPRLGVEYWIYALLSLTVIRMAPVALSLVGAGLSLPTVAFIGWFGPRGLASIVLFLLYLEGIDDRSAAAPLAVTATVCLSIFAHGASARPSITAYARRVRDLPASAPERREVRDERAT